MGKSVKERHKEAGEIEHRKSISFTVTMKGIDDAEQLLMKMLDREGEPSNARVGAIRALLDSKYRKLNKILPDLKSVDLQANVRGNVDGNWTVEFVNAETKGK